MTWSSFLIRLGAITTILLITVTILARLYEAPDALLIYLLSILFFVVFSLGLFWYARMISQSGKDFTFFGVVSGSFLLKLVGAIALLWTYQEWKNPTDSKFGLHFILVYIIYTSFEVYFLTKLAKTPEA